MRKIVAIIVLITLSLVALNAKSYKYDDLNRVIEVSYESGEKILYDYDEAGNMISQRFVEKPQPYVSENETATHPCVIKDLPKGQSGICIPIKLGEVESMSTVRFDVSLDADSQSVNGGIETVLDDEVVMLHDNATMDARVSLRDEDDRVAFSSINSKFVVSHSVVDENRTIETTMQVEEHHKIVMTLNPKGDVDVKVTIGEKSIYVDSNFINSHVYVDVNGSVVIYREMIREEKRFRTLITIDKRGTTLMRFIELDAEGKERELYREEKLDTYSNSTNINILEISNEMYISLVTKLNGKIIEE